LSLLDSDNLHRLKVATYYYEHFNNDQVITANDDFLSNNVWHVFPVFVIDREHFQNYMLKHGVETNIHYPVPPHQQKAFKELNDLSFPQTEYLHRSEVSLPCHPLTTQEEMDYIVKLVNDY